MTEPKDFEQIIVRINKWVEQKVEAGWFHQNQERVVLLNDWRRLHLFFYGDSPAITGFAIEFMRLAWNNQYCSPTWNGVMWSCKPTYDHIFGDKTEIGSILLALEAINTLCLH